MVFPLTPRTFTIFIISVVAVCLVVVGGTVLIQREDARSVAIPVRGSQAFGSLASASLLENSKRAPLAADTGTSALSAGEAFAIEPIGTIFEVPTGYDYVGEEQTIPAEVMVLRRISGIEDVTVRAASDISLSSLIPGSEGGAVRSIEYAWGEYRVTVDTMRGSASVYNANEAVVSQEFRELQPDEVPTDERLLDTAREFLTASSISTSGFDSPYVTHLGKSIDQQSRVMGGTRQVIYPYKLNDKKVYYQYGGRFGMSLEINTSTMKVSRVDGIANVRHEASAYPAVTNFSSLVERATKGGYSGATYDGMEKLAISTDASTPTRANNPTSTRGKLGTPEMVYVLVTRYASQDTSDFLVPALAFPVIESISLYDQSEEVVVPLVDGL